MGRTVATSTMIIDRMENGVFRAFIKGALPSEKMIIKRLFSFSRNHISAIGMAGHLLPFESILLSMQHEQQKQIRELMEILGK